MKIKGYCPIIDRNVILDIDDMIEVTDSGCPRGKYKWIPNGFFSCSAKQKTEHCNHIKCPVHVDFNEFCGEHPVKYIDQLFEIFNSR